jgi:hypothetical protein
MQPKGNSQIRTVRLFGKSQTVANRRNKMKLKPEKWDLEVDFVLLIPRALS